MKSAGLPYTQELLILSEASVLVHMGLMMLFGEMG